MRRSLIVVCAVALLPLTRAAPAHATTCAAAPTAAPNLQTIDGRERLRWIEARLARQASKANDWRWGWAIGIGAAGLGSLAAVPFVATSDRVDWYAGAVTAAIGVVPFIVAPPAVTRDAPRLRDAVAVSSGYDDARVCSLLADAEGKLAADAADQQWQRGWWMHAGNLAFNTGVLLFLGLGYHHWLSGVINGAAGAVVGETVIFTQPTGLVEDAAAYKRGELYAGSGGGGISLGWTYDGRF